MDLKRSGKRRFPRPKTAAYRGYRKKLKHKKKRYLGDMCRKKYASTWKTLGFETFRPKVDGPAPLSK